ncbi:hypothetical protein PQQ72_24375 [Paraburkholderia strydomiana]|uniref:tetratricopeptide repeat protein n=1 Tax=Paraburkholderia strydomiana TaxID=1245417 RepID=UPI0038B89CA5
MESLADIYERDAKMDEHFGLLTRAIDTMKFATLLDPAAPRLLYLSQLLLNAGELTAAKQAVEKAERKYGTDVPLDALYCRGTIDARSGDLESATLAYVQANSRFPGHAASIYALGSVYACRGEIELADALFAKDVGVMTGNGSVTYTRALRFRPERSVHSSSLKRVVHPNTEGPRLTDGWRAVYLVAADSTYFCRYAKALVRSIERYGKGSILLHLHVVNPTPEAQSLMHLISKSAGATTSTEEVDLSGLNDVQRKTYYACARYLILPDVSSIYSCPIVVADMDQMLMADPAPLFNLAEGNDVCLLRFENQKNNLFSLISATVLLVAPTSNGMEFARKLASNIQRAAGSVANLVWHLDQAALAIVYLENPQINYGFIPPSVVHLTDGEPPRDRGPEVGIFWSITNSIAANLNKLKTESFKELL